MPMGFFQDAALHARSIEIPLQPRNLGSLVGRGRQKRPTATARERAPVWMAARQFRSIDGEMPTSVATCIKADRYFQAAQRPLV